MLNSTDQKTINDICQEVLGDKIREEFSKKQLEVDYADNPDIILSKTCDFSAEYKQIRQRILDAVPALKSAKTALTNLSISTNDLYDLIDQEIDKGVKHFAQVLANTADYNVYDVEFGGKALYYKIASIKNAKYQSAKERVTYLRQHGLDAEYNGYCVVVHKLLKQKKAPYFDITMVENDDGRFSLLVEEPDPKLKGFTYLGGKEESVFLETDEDIDFLATALPIMRRYVRDKPIVVHNLRSDLIKDINEERTDGDENDD